MDLDALLFQEIEDLNRDNPDDRRISSAIIMERPDPNGLHDDSSSSSSDEDGGRRGRFGFLRFGRSSSPARPHYRSYGPGSDGYEDDLAIRDPELFQITERNRRISYDMTNQPAQTEPEDEDDAEQPAAKARKRRPRPAGLTFSSVPVIDTKPNRIHVQLDYGVSSSHVTKRSRRYLIACDFSECSLNAMDFAFGTMLRNGDVIHVASVIGMDDDLDSMDEDDKYRLWQELDRNSKMLISKVKSIMEHMLLYNIKLHFYSLAGPTRECLMNLIHSLPLTMVVCGSSGRRALAGMFMGGVSSYLVQKSVVPVTVVRPQTKQKKNKKKLTPAQKLSQSVRDGYLKVDEMETPDHRSINSHGCY
ncbi:adenine nucleotide alpha hydrolases-like protein [Hesseltinella vesiculosa]|uniref:Adenine nucleotide alpha hydrolases-like protein n=1 Tax=Hesseltinella vesiculosa TaxID=101127 RepID=A0A1X2GW08_9FUNG|nr:adenine nucleotide alpha hydrolases-like protein [Hesseltinella vesiculosa]